MHCAAILNSSKTVKARDFHKRPKISMQSPYSPLILDSPQNLKNVFSVLTENKSTDFFCF